MTTEVLILDEFFKSSGNIDKNKRVPAKVSIILHKGFLARLET
jgi:hypothetical protein